MVQTDFALLSLEATMFRAFYRQVGFLGILVLGVLVLAVLFLLGAIPELNLTYKDDRVLGAFILVVAFVTFCFTGRGGIQKL